MLVTKFSGTFEESGVKVENVSGVGFTSRRTTKEEGHLTVGDSLFGKIVEDDEGVLSLNVWRRRVSLKKGERGKDEEANVVTEPFSDGSSGEGGEVLEGGGFGSSGGDDDRVLH